MKSNSQHDSGPKPPLRCVGREELVVALLQIGIFLAFVLLPAASRAGWLEGVQQLLPGDFRPPPDKLRARYVFGWSGIQAAAADVQLERGAGGRWNAMVRGGTTGAARKLWKLDADFTSEIAEKGWQSVYCALTENYQRYRVTETSEFRPGGVRSRRESTKEGASPGTWLNFYVPGLRDMAGALLLARSQPLNNGDNLSLAVFPGEWMYLVRLKVLGREKLRWQGEKRDVLRCALEIDWIDKDYSLKPHKKFQRGTVWVSDDELRLPLRVEVKVFVGHVFAELVEVKANG